MRREDMTIIQRKFRKRVHVDKVKNRNIRNKKQTWMNIMKAIDVLMHLGATGKVQLRLQFLPSVQ